MTSPPATLPDPLQVVELRQYTLHRGRRDALIDLFELEFVESQEACGIRLLGTFRDLDDPDRFVWLRGFPALSMRAGALGAFYGGPAWQRHRDAANATMADSDDVHLLRPARDADADAFARRAPRPPSHGTVEACAGLFTVTLARLRDAPDAALHEAFDTLVRPHWNDADGRLVACLATAPGPNDFPRLPVHEGRPVLAWLTRFADAAAQARHAGRVAPLLDAPAWRDRLLAPARTTRLAPTARSALR